MFWKLLFCGLGCLLNLAGSSLKWTFFFLLKFILSSLYYSLTGRCQKIPQSLVLIKKQLFHLGIEHRRFKYLFLVGLKGLQSQYLDLKEMWRISRFPICKTTVLETMSQAKFRSPNSFGAQRVQCRLECPWATFRGYGYAIWLYRPF